MKRIYSLATVVVLSVIILSLIASQAGTPALYSPKSDAVTPYHTNPAALEKITGDQAERLLPLMSDLLNTPGTLVLNLKYNDLDRAGRDLAEYRELTRSIDNLVINLDMSGSEVEEFRNMNQKNLQILSELFNETSRFEELNKLEIRYKDEKDPAILTSITYEGQSLRNRVRQLYSEYRAQKEPMVEVSSDFELNTTNYEESHTDFAEIVRTIEQVQAQRTNDLQTLPVSALSSGTLSISVTPSQGVYNTVLTINGLYSGAEVVQTPVEIFIDSEKVADINTDRTGYYRHSYTIRDIPEGIHTVFAVAGGSVYSDITGFAVNLLNTKLILLPPERSGGKYICRGSFSGISGEPLTNTPLQIITDKKTRHTVVTDGTGIYSTSVSLPPGTHTVQAIFQNRLLPLSPAESEVYTIDVPRSTVPFTPGGSAPPDPVTLLVVAGVIGASVAGSIYYLRRRAGPRNESVSPIYGGSTDEITARESSGHLTGEDEQTPEDPAPVLKDQKDAIDLLQLMKGHDLLAAAHDLFLSLRRNISIRLSLKHSESLTPRELCLKSRDLSFYDNLKLFIRRYEIVRYSGTVPSEDDRDELESTFSATSRDLEDTDEKSD
jgi:hypothetical protein